jgi:hypothetical protein
LFVIREIEDISKDLPRIAREIEAQGPVALVIVDTSPSLFKGDDENSNKQMGDHARNIRKLCDLPGRPVTVALCHPPKHPSSKADLLPRGGGAYLAEVDGNLTLWGHDDRLCDLHWTGKFRGPDFENITFRLTTVITTRLIDKKGRALPTVMAEVATAAEAEETEQQTIFQENRLLTTMLRNPNGSLTDWASDCGWFLRGEVPNKSLVRRVIIRLQKEKLVAKEGRDFTLTKAGKVAAKRAAPEPMEGSKSRHEKRDTI